MNKLTTLTLAALLLAPLVALHAAEPTTTQQIDQKTLDEWSAPYRGWHYYPDPVIPSDWKIPANEKFYMYYCACGNKGRCVGLITSKPLKASDVSK